MADVPAYMQPYQGLHDEAYDAEEKRKAKRGFVGGLLDSVTDAAGHLVDPEVAANLAFQFNPIGAAYNSYKQAKGLLTGETTPGAVGKSLLDMTPVGPAIDAVQASGDVGTAVGSGDSYGAGQSTGKLLGAALAVAPPVGRVKKAEKAFEVAAPRGGFLSDLSKTAYPTSVDDMTFMRQPNGLMLPRKVVNPEVLQDSLLYPLIGDRTIAGQTLTGINGEKLAFPVNLDGGPNFTRGPQQVADNAFWASNPSPNTGMAKKMRTQLETGDPLHGVYTMMGSRGGDFSHMMSDTLLAQIPAAPITKTAKREFDVAMRAINPKWPGLDAPNLREVLADNGKLRTQMAENMALGAWRDKGFPDAATSRAAITEPDLLRVPGSGGSGHTIVRVTDPKVIKDPNVPHGTYKSQVGGADYVGGLTEPVPRSLLWPDAYAQMEKEGIKPNQMDYTFTRRQPVQRFGQQQLDNLMKWLNRK